MKRGWMGFWLLVILLAGCLLTTFCMVRCHDRIADDLQTAAEYAVTGQWENAKSLARNARLDWEASWHFSAAFADHEPMEEIDSLFAQLEVYKSCEEEMEFASVCTQLSRRVKAMGDAHGVAWWNLL